MARIHRHPFDLAVQQMSVRQLKLLAKLFGKRIGQAETREDHANLLISTMTAQQKAQALRTFVLAGRTSLSIYHIDTDEPVRFREDFTRATAEPTIVHAGPVGGLISGLQHVQWAMLDGNSTFLDPSLHLRVEPEAVIINSFYDPHSKLLQIRSDSTTARKVARSWAAHVGADFDKQVSVRGMTSVVQVHAFCDRIGASVKGCAGDVKEIDGFGRMSGRRAPHIADLRDRADYQTFTEQTILVESVIEFEHDGKRVTIGLGLDAQSVFFQTTATEDAIQYVYGELKTFLKL